MTFSDEFLNPPKEYGPVPFWFLNERLDEERLRWQVQQMKEQHVFGAVMHARPGLVTPYLTESWFSAIGTILDEAKRQEMFMWLYDDYPWMSGMAEWRVPALHPDFRIRALDRIEKTVMGGGEFVWEFDKDLPDNHAGLVAAVAGSIGDNGKLLGGLVEVSADIDNRTLRIDLPDGPHLISIFFERLSWNPYGDNFGKDAVSDLMHPQAIKSFIELTHAEYERRFPEYLGSTIAASFTDEPPADTPGWSRGFLEQFELRKSYDLKPYLPFLWQDNGRLSNQVRFDYQDVLGQLYEENFFGQIEQWCEKVGIASTGHLLLEETLVFHARFMGDYFRAMRRLHSPGIDYIFPGRIPAITCKLAASVASLYQRDRVMSECFALTGWNFTFEHMKWMTDWQIVNGINCLVPHAFFYSTREDVEMPKIPSDLGFRWFDCPPSMFFQQPYWDYYSVYADYLRRLQWLVSQGDHICQLAIYYPIETVQASFIPTKDYANAHAFEIPGTWMTADYLWTGSTSEQTDAHFRAIGNLLRENGFDYDVIDDDSLRVSAVENGLLSVRMERSYRAIVLPRTEWLAVDVYQKIERFWEQGGIVIATGCLPAYAVDGPHADRVITQISESIFGISPVRAKWLLEQGSEFREKSSAYFFSQPGDEMIKLLHREDLGDFQCDCPNLYAHHRRFDGRDAYFLAYQSNVASGPSHVALSGQGTPMLYDPLTGSGHPVEFVSSESGAVIRLEFDAWESYFIVFEPAGFSAMTVPARVSVEDLRPALFLEGPWKVSLDGGNRHPFRTCDLPPLPEWDTMIKNYQWNELKPWEELGLLDFSGAATYETRFEWDLEAVGPAWLDLGEVGIVAEVWLNGANLGVALWKTYRFNIQGVLRQGDNDLRVRVANTLANAIQASYGNRAVPTQASDEYIQSYATFQLGELRSGLIGPVRVLTI